MHSIIYILSTYRKSAINTMIIEPAAQHHKLLFFSSLNDSSCNTNLDLIGTINHCMFVPLDNSPYVHKVCHIISDKRLSVTHSIHPRASYGSQIPGFFFQSQIKWPWKAIEESWTFKAPLELFVQNR